MSGINYHITFYFLKPFSVIETAHLEESNSENSNAAAVEESHTALGSSRTSSALPTFFEGANTTTLPTSPELDNTTTIEVTSPNPGSNGSVSSSIHQGRRTSTTLSYHSNTEDLRDPRGAVIDTDNPAVLSPIASQTSNVSSQEAIIVASTPSVQLHPVHNNDAPPPYPGPPMHWRLHHEDSRISRNSSTIPLLFNETSSNYNERRQEQARASRAIRTVNVQSIPTIVSALLKQVNSVYICLFICLLSIMTLLPNNITNHEHCVYHFHYASFLFH